MIDLNLIITTVALIVNGLKNPLKYRHIQVALKKIKGRITYATYKKHTSIMNIQVS